MKSKKLKLELNKETIAVLDEMQLNQVHGGTGSSQACAQTIKYTVEVAVAISTNILFEEGKDTSYWRCDPNVYIKMEDKSQWVGRNGGATLDNTAVSHGGQYICIKPY